MKITIDIQQLEHLLNCLANQKWIHELSEEDRRKVQIVIDEAWFWGMDIVNAYKNYQTKVKNLTDKLFKLESPIFSKLSGDCKGVYLPSGVGVGSDLKSTFNED